MQGCVVWQNVQQVLLSRIHVGQGVVLNIATPILVTVGGLIQDFRQGNFKFKFHTFMFSVFLETRLFRLCTTFMLWLLPPMKKNTCKIKI